MSNGSVKDIVSVVAFVALSAVFALLWFAQNSRVEENSHRIDVIEELYRRSADRWTGTDQKKWCDELQRLNPELRLPK